MQRNRTMRYGDVNFDESFMGATDGEGQDIRFTEAESELLRQLVRRPHVVMSRGRLLDAMTNFGEDAGDRFIDFLVNRIRTKLGDRPRHPRFIATRYGGGYVWIADRHAPARPSADTFIVVGPLLVRPENPDLMRAASAFARDVTATLNSQLEDPHRAALDIQCPGPSAFDEDAPRFQLEIHALALGGKHQFAATLKHFATGTVLRVSRETATDTIAIEAMVRHCLDAIWHRLGIADGQAQTPAIAPLPVRLHDAARADTGQTRIWRENEERLRKRLAIAPEPDLQLMLASALHAKYVQDGIAIFAEGDPRADDEAEIEALTCAALPKVQHNGLQALTAAKLLYFVDPAHRPNALAIARKAYETTPAFASALALYGQLLMWEGDLAQAGDLYASAMALCDTEDTFYFYLLTLRAQNQVAAGDPGAAATIAKLCNRSESSRRFFALIFDGGDAVDLQADLASQLGTMPASRASAILRFQNYVCARLFVDPGQGARLMAHPGRILVEHFGPEIVPPEARDLIAV